jgi:hypothetical protein
MKKCLFAIATGIIIAGIISGCTPSSTKSSQPLTKVETNGLKPSTPSTSWRAVGDESFLLQGKIVGVHMASPEYSLKLHIDYIIVPGALRRPSPKFPYNVGTTVTIRFDEPFPSKGPMEPKVGNEIELRVMQYTAGSNRTPFWGSRVSQYCYEKNGQFYDANGDVVTVAT